MSTRIVFVGGDDVAGRSYRLIAVHALCEDANDDVKDAFWDELQNCTSSMLLVNYAHVVGLLIDANARVGSESDGSSIGAYEPGGENNNGIRFRCFLVRNVLSLVIPFLVLAKHGCPL